MEVALEAWKNIGLGSLQEELNVTGLRISQVQEEGRASRQRLAELTRQFKRTPDDEKLSQFKDLLKSYQMEIDAVTARARNAETAFLQVYQKLSTVPDPVPLMENIMIQSINLKDMATLKADNERLREEIASIDFNRINELEDLNVGLKNRLARQEVQLNDMVQQRVAEKEKELLVVMEEKAQLFRESEHALQRQVAHLQDEIMALQSSHKSTQEKLLSSNQVTGEVMSGKHAELDMLMADLERSRYKIVQLEHDNTTLKRQLEELNIDNDFELQTKELQERITELEYQLHSRKEEFIINESKWAQKLALEKAEIKSLAEQVTGLQHQLALIQDYDEIKKELEIIKNIQFAGVESPTNGTSASIEQLLANKNKKLEGELTSIKVEMSEKDAALDLLTRDLAYVREQVHDKTQLILKLESDLSKINHSNYSRKNSTHENFEDLILGGLVGSPSDPLTNTPKSSNSDMLAILKSQRDRFKERSDALEAQCRSHMQRIQQLEIEQGRLKQDNIKLYEKLRYLESYRQQDSYSSPSSSFTAISLRDDGDVTRKYQPLYENNLDPFKRFHRQEETRRINNLNPAEQFLFVITKVISTSRYARWGFICYLAALHILVFTSLHQVMLTADCHHELARSLAHKDDLTT